MSNSGEEQFRSTVSSPRKDVFFRGPGRFAQMVCILLGCIAPAVGCNSFTQPFASHSSTAPLDVRSDRVDLEIIFAKYPADHVIFAEDLWSQVDEQAIPADLRRALRQEGFRVGVLGGSIPAELERVLQLGQQTTSVEQELNAEQLEQDTPVKLRLLETRSGHRGEIATSSTYEQLPLLVCEEGALRGRTFEKAETRLGVLPEVEADGRVRLEIVPEIEYGQPRSRFAGSDGIWRFDASRPKHRFDALRLSLTLAPGQMLLLTSTRGESGGAGHYFFQEPQDGVWQQKLVIVRLANAGSRPWYAEPPAHREQLVTDL